MQTHPHDRTVFEIAHKQSGAVARWQLRARGVSDKHIRRRVDQGVLTPLNHRVLVVTGSPDTANRRIAAGVLDAGPNSLLGFGTAAWRWGLPGHQPDPVEAIGERRRTRHGRDDLSIIHQPRRLFPSHVVEVDGIPTTTPTRTIFDIASEPDVNPLHIENLIDRAWSRRLIDHWTLSGVLDDLAVRGRPGIVLMRGLIEDRGPDYMPAESNLEDRFRAVMGRAGLMGFSVQANVMNDRLWLGRVDVVYERERVVVEIDSTLYHESITDRRHDLERQRGFEEAGWSVVRVNEHDLWHAPERVVDVVWRALSPVRRRTGAQIRP